MNTLNCKQITDPVSMIQISILQRNIHNYPLEYQRTEY